MNTPNRKPTDIESCVPMCEVVTCWSIVLKLEKIHQEIREMDSDVFGFYFSFVIVFSYTFSFPLSNRPCYFVFFQKRKLRPETPMSNPDLTLVYHIPF